MDQIGAFAFAYVSGLVACGMAATLMELLVGKKLSFAPPFFDRDRPGLMVFATLLAGPMMLANDGLDARRNGHIGPLALTCLLLTVSIWALSMGVAFWSVAEPFLIG